MDFGCFGPEIFLRWTICEYIIRYLGGEDSSLNMKFVYLVSMEAASAASVVRCAHEAGTGFTTNIITAQGVVDFGAILGFRFLKMGTPHLHSYVYIYLCSAIHVPLSLSVGRFVIYPVCKSEYKNFWITFCAGVGLCSSCSRWNLVERSNSYTEGGMPQGPLHNLGELFWSCLSSDL